MKKLLTNCTLILLSVILCTSCTEQQADASVDRDALLKEILGRKKIVVYDHQMKVIDLSTVKDYIKLIEVKEVDGIEYHILDRTKKVVANQFSLQERRLCMFGVDGATISVMQSNTSGRYYNFIHYDNGEVAMVEITKYEANWECTFV